MTKPTIFITSASEVSGFDAAKELLSEEYKDKFEQVICGISPDQSSFMDKLREMGAQVEELDPRTVNKDHVTELFKKADLVYIVPPLQHDVDTKKICKLYIDACKEADVMNCILLSAIQPRKHHKHHKHHHHKASDESDDYEDMHHHYKYLNTMKEIEKHLSDSQIENYAILRRSVYQELFHMYADVIKNDRTLKWPLGSGTMAPVNIKDVSRCVAKICSELEEKDQGLIWSNIRMVMRAEHCKKTYTLTGPSHLTGYDMAMIATHALSKPVKIIPDKFVYVGYEDVSREEAEKYLVEEGTLPRSHIDLIMDIFELARRGDLDFTTRDYKKIVGWPADPLHKFFTESADEFGLL